MSTKIEYNGAVIATVEGGNVATIPCRDKKMASDLVITIPEAGGDTYDGAGTVTALIEDLVITIGTTTYSILPLMTWYEWANSEYNTGGFTCGAEDSKVFLGGSQNYLLDSDGNAVYGNTAITTGGTYTISYATTILSSDSAKIVAVGGVILTLKEN